MSGRIEEVTSRTPAGPALPNEAAGTPPTSGGEHVAYVQFMRDAEPALRRAFVSRYGFDIGREVTADALAYGWEHWTRLQRMRNPVGYLFRVGQSAARRHHRRGRTVVERPAVDDPRVEPALTAGLAELSDRQRTLVLLVHGFGYSIAEAATTTGVTKATAQRHVDRGLAKLRSHLEVDNG